MEARPEWIGAMATSGVEAGGDSPGPAEAIVGSGLVALRSDLSEFMGWVVALQGGNEDLPPKDALMLSPSVRRMQMERAAGFSKSSPMRS